MLIKDLNISKPLRNAIDDLGFVEATPIQEKAFAPILSGRDIVGIAQTGTGKTLAYLLPVLRNLAYSEQRHPRVLILVPTRELVLQVEETLNSLTTYMSVRIAGVYGGTNINTQKKLVYAGLDVLVATPGRLLDLVLCGMVRLKSVQKLVIDEVDEMLNLGFQTQLESIFDALPVKRQNLLFSATLNYDVSQLVDAYFHEPERVEIERSGTPLAQIQQYVYELPNYGTKTNLLDYLLIGDESMSKVLVFVSNKKMADKLYERMFKRYPDQVGVLHANKSQNYRIRSLKKMEAGEYRMMISTDLMARGLDITGLTHIINFDLPEVPEDYIHRIGRTGRAEESGVAISFVEPHEHEARKAIESLMNFTIPTLDFPDKVEIATTLTEEERIRQQGVYKVKKTFSPRLSGGGAFHEKKAKNMKTNSGSPSRKRKLKLKGRKKKK